MQKNKTEKIIQTSLYAKQLSQDAYMRKIQQVNLEWEVFEFGENCNILQFLSNSAYPFRKNLDQLKI